MFVRKVTPVMLCDNLRLAETLKIVAELEVQECHGGVRGPLFDECPLETKKSCRTNFSGVPSTEPSPMNSNAAASSRRWCLRKFGTKVASFRTGVIIGTCPVGIFGSEAEGSFGMYVTRPWLATTGLSKVPFSPYRSYSSHNS